MNLVPNSATFQEFLRSRRSVRQFLPDPVPKDVIKRVLHTAIHAPSAHNHQPWCFVVLESAGTRKLLVDNISSDFYHDLVADGVSSEEAKDTVAQSRRRIIGSPVAILLILDPSSGDVYPDKVRQRAEYLMGVQGVALAGGKLLLAAHAEGLGGVWICAPLFAPETIHRALDLPAVWEPQGMILLGYPARIPSQRPRKPVDEVTKFL